MTLSGSYPRRLAHLRECYNCGEPTDRYIKFRMQVGTVYDFECLDCRQKRVQAQVDAGLRPASDLLPENLLRVDYHLPERRNPAS